jgi:hypothetical protein
MSRPPIEPTSLDPRPDEPLAADLAQVCDRAICRDAPVLVGLVATEAGFVLDPGTAFDIPEDLLTLDIPATGAGVALVADGRCRSIDRPHAVEVGGARFCFALTRDGRSHSLMITREGAHRSASGAGEPPSGHAVDVCHRLLDLQTPVEARSVLRLVHVEWLADLADLATAPTMSGLCDDWTVVASLHPCAHTTRRTGPDALGRAAAREVEGCTWEGIHRALVAVSGRLGHIPPAAVARLDGPSFARFALAARPPLEGSWAELCAVVDPRTLSRIRRSMTTAGDDVNGFPLVHRRFVDEG